MFTEIKEDMRLRSLFGGESFLHFKEFVTKAYSFFYLLLFFLPFLMLPFESDILFFHLECCFEMEEGERRITARRESLKYITSPKKWQELLRKYTRLTAEKLHMMSFLLSIRTGIYATDTFLL